LNLCRGHDSSIIIDDGGTLQKSLSVENSLRSGTIRTKEQVMGVMEDLYRRLPLLLKDRMEWSDHPSLAYPTVIRITARSSIDKIGSGRKNRKFITRSTQCKFDGKLLCNNLLNANETTTLLRRSVTPLLRSLLFTSSDINVTRLNICVSNFQDIDVVASHVPVAQRPLATFVSPEQSHL
jgi:impB/mucB/samB family C-terminal domain